MHIRKVDLSVDFDLSVGQPSGGPQRLLWLRRLHLCATVLFRFSEIACCLMTARHLDVMIPTRSHQSVRRPRWLASTQVQHCISTYIKFVAGI